MCRQQSGRVFSHELGEANGRWTRASVHTVVLWLARWPQRVQMLRRDRQAQRYTRLGASARDDERPGMIGSSDDPSDARPRNECTWHSSRTAHVTIAWRWCVA
jgi:hypothetical protein